MVVIAYMHVRVAADVVYNAAANITDQSVINVAILLQHLINVYFVLLLCVAHLFSRQHICIGTGEDFPGLALTERSRIVRQRAVRGLSREGLHG